MSIFVWCKSFELGIELFDEHHKHLVDLLNNVFDNFITGDGHKIVGPVIDELIDYATYHFAAEEHWMEEHNYLKLKQHREEHELFFHNIVEIQKDYQNQTANQSLKILTFLKNWLSDHILKSDVEFVYFCKTSKPESELSSSLDFYNTDGPDQNQHMEWNVEA